MPTHSSAVQLALLIMIVAQSAALAGLVATWLRSLDCGSVPAAALRGGVAFGATVAIGLTFLGLACPGAQPLVRARPCQGLHDVRRLLGLPVRG